MRCKSQICYSRHGNECERERMKERLRLLDLHALVTSALHSTQSMCEAASISATPCLMCVRILRDGHRIV